MSVPHFLQCDRPPSTTEESRTILLEFFPLACSIRLANRPLIMKLLTKMANRRHSFWHVSQSPHGGRQDLIIMPQRIITRYCEWESSSLKITSLTTQDYGRHSTKVEEYNGFMIICNRWRSKLVIIEWKINLPYFDLMCHNYFHSMLNKIDFVFFFLY